MNSRDPVDRAHDEWSVTLNGRYVVRFYGVNAREYATRQLRELAALLGFEEAPRELAPTAGASVENEPTAD